MSLRGTGALILAIIFALGAAPLSGCSVLDGTRSGSTTVTDFTALFHFDVPASWQAVVRPGTIAVAASKEPITDKRTLDTLWMLVYTGTEPSTTPVPQMLVSLVDQRSVSREWTAAEMGKPAKTKVGGIDGYVVSASGTDKDGVDFKGRFYLVRTKSHEVVIQCVAPAADLDEFAEDIDRILGERWFWSPAATSSEEASEGAGAS